MRVVCCSLIAYILVALPGSAQTLLTWKLKKGQVFDAERLVTHKQSVTLKDKQLKHLHKSQWHVRLEVLEVHETGSKLRATLVKVEHELTGTPASELLDAQLADKMQGAAFTLELTRAGQVSKFAGYENLLKQLAKEDKSMRKALQASLPEVTLKEALADFFGPLPDKAVSKKDRWRREYLEPIPHFGTLKATVNYVHDGADADRVRIAYALETKYEPLKDDMMVLFRIEKGAIESPKAQGAFVFDSAAGRLIEHQRSLHLRGSLLIDTMDRQVPLQFTSETDVKVVIKSSTR